MSRRLKELKWKVALKRILFFMLVLVVLMIVILIMTVYIPEKYLGYSILSLLFGLIVIILAVAIRKGLKSMQINSVVSKMFL